MASSEQTKFKPSKIKTRQTYESVEQALGEHRDLITQVLITCIWEKQVISDLW